MKDNRECKIIQDLLPSYVDKLTNEDTNKYIEEHLLECDDCRRILESMKRDLKVNNLKEECKKVKYIKKYNKKLKIFEITTFILMLSIIGILVYGNIYFRAAYSRAVNALIETNKSVKNIDTYYATIETIEDSELPEIKTIKVKGLDVNDVYHRGELYFNVLIDTNDSKGNIRIEFNGECIDFSKLKVGQRVAIYNMRLDSDADFAHLQSVIKIVVLDEQL